MLIVVAEGHTECNDFWLHYIATMSRDKGYEESNLADLRHDFGNRLVIKICGLQNMLTVGSQSVGINERYDTQRG
jgi:hypothetical protein